MICNIQLQEGISEQIFSKGKIKVKKCRQSWSLETEIHAIYFPTFWYKWMTNLSPGFLVVRNNDLNTICYTIPQPPSVLKERKINQYFQEGIADTRAKEQFLP